VTGLSARMSIDSPSCSRRRCDGRRATVGYGDGVGLHLSQIDEADELLTNDPLALLIGMVLDQPVSERWSGAGQSALT